ncbi:MAG: NAD(P)-dependent oxidoreductase [Herbinix sp.]|nr:NAD(P)-dependent oxidoreductase [Herbinix sp.]
MKSIFITGIAGMLGSNIAYLLRDKYPVSGVDLHEINIQKVNSYVFSAMDMEQIKQHLINNEVDTLIHCAALVNVDECEVNPEYANQINITLTQNLTQLCEELEIKLIFISTDAVFDGTDNFLYKESDTPNPISVYGKTKLEAENIVLAVNRNLVARTNIYGFNYREKSSFGEWIINSLISNIELNMFYDIFFSPILVNELAKIIDQCIENKITGLYHISSTGSISKYDIAVAIMEEFKLEGSINKVSMENFSFKAPRTKNMGLCNDKIRQVLGITIRTPEEGVKEFKRLYDIKYYEDLRKG